ncbi:aminotransferase class IV [Leucobacter insecticola]|uniref:Aminotransferase class IV n=1 Tax=Leucobacter insecticola TaxID=2714934 RepID=A0A6G8FKP9_9MICO|nr:aminotransferase class IV [Leucobacter insecticola]QIM16652.1 aminotransferase class IV [Leucobacter insecticola]
MTADQRRLLVADSFRVRVNPATGQPEVRGWDRHLARFLTGVCAVTESQSADGFLADAVSRIQEYGEGFPRLELWGGAGQDPEFALSLRPLPELGTQLEMRSFSGFTLESRARKGPNIARLAELNRELGAEALLTDAEGYALEGATTSLVWWDPTDQEGYVVEARRHRVASVTEQLLTHEFAIAPSRISPADLTQCEVWAVNALHGIRVVTAIDGVPTQHPQEARLKWFREALDRYWQPLTQPDQRA